MSQNLFASVTEAQELLRSYSLSPQGNDIDSQKCDRLRQAILWLKKHSEYQIIGICAQDYDRGIFALQTYCLALDYEPPLDLNPIQGAVYIKFNPHSQLRYISPYVGSERGVLVSYQSPHTDGISELYGHFPLNLFSSDVVKSQKP